MPDRMIREKARRSRSLKNLSDAAERAWWRLTVTCDDYGRFDADAELLVAQLFERRPRSWTAEKMAKAIVEWTQSFADAPQPLVHLYQRPDDEALYGHIVSFMDHQRERDSKPKYPDPPCGGKTEDAAKCRDSRHIGGNLPQLAAEGNAPGSASRGEPPQLAAGRGEPLQLAARAETGSGGRKAESGSGAGAGAGEGKGGVGGRGNGVDPDLKVTLLATKHLQPLADDRHADLWTSLEKAYDAYPWLFFEEEVAKADAWCESHPARRPTPRGLPAFMRNWLDKAVEIGRKQHREAQA